MSDSNLDTDLITHETKIIDDRVVTIVPQTMWTYMILPYHFMMTPSDGNIFRVTGHLCGEFTGPRWITRTKASDAELWCFLWSASE